jgi:WhiB family transcriptional regulator, redox-sensing transcriptional regulator
MTGRLWPPRPGDASPAAPPWMALAACQYTDPDAFYPEVGEPADRQKAVCRSCQVRPDCLLYAAAGREQWGIWGGFSERQRRRPGIGQIATRTDAETVIAADDARFYARQDAAEAAHEHRRLRASAQQPAATPVAA